MKVKLQKIGNSVGVILPKEVLARLHVGYGDEMMLSESNGGVILSPYSEDTASQLALGREILSRRRNILKALAQ
jgi:putative addiction module antidote